MITREQEFFIRILADHAAGRTTESVFDLDWNEILRLSQIHELGGVVYYQCRSFLPQDCAASFRAMFDAAQYSYMLRQAAMREIEETFRENGIVFFLIKGPVVAQYYPVPALRTMGDLDIVIHREDRDRAHEILLQHGFVNTSHLEDREWQYFRNDLEYELHDHLVYYETVNREKLEAFFNDFWPHVKDGKLDISFHFLFLLLHLRKHLMNSGAGFRMFMDLALMGMKESELNWPWIREKLEELELLPFAQVCAGFIHRWFGVVLPLEEKLPDQAFYEAATEAVLANGVFGYDNAENRVNSTANIARQMGYWRLEIVRRTLRLIFPPYHVMLKSRYGGFVENRKWLLPAAWVYRLFRASGPILRGQRDLPFHHVSGEQIRQRDDYLRQWGL